MDNNEAFQNWFESKLAESRANNDLDMHRNLTRYVGFYKYGFEAAQQQSAGEIEKLKEQLKLGGKISANNFSKVLELKADNERLQAQVNELRNALEVANRLDYVREHPAISSIVEQALAKTAPQSLVEHDNEVIERCALALENAEGELKYLPEYVDVIRKLKGTP